MEKQKLDNNEIELRKTDLDELLGRTPSGLVRWGITVFLGILIIAIFFCSIVHFPKIITSPIIVTAQHPATWIVSKVNGKVDTIMVHEGSCVKAGTVLAAISNSCSYDDIILLESYLDSLSQFLNDYNVSNIKFCNKVLQLGELQSEFGRLNTLLADYELFCMDNYYNKMYNNTLMEISEQNEYLNNLIKQKELVDSNEQMYYNKYVRDSVLYEKKAIQITEYEKSKQQLIYGKMESAKLDLTINSTSVGLINLNSRKIENRALYNSKMQSYKNDISGSYNQLRSLLSIWKNQYVLVSPISGHINLSGIWSKNQQVKAGEAVIAILPDNTGNIIGKCSMSVSGIGKIKLGNNVVIKLDSYPFLEYGIISGVVSNISKMPQIVESNGTAGAIVMAEIDIPSPLTTSYGQKLNFSGELTGTAEIIIDDMTILEHFVSPLRYLFNKTN